MFKTTYDEEDHELMNLINKFYTEFLRNVGYLSLDTVPSAERSWERLVVKKGEEKIVWLRVHEKPFWGLRFDLQQNGGIKLLGMYDLNIKPYDRCQLWDNDFRARSDDDKSTPYPIEWPSIDETKFSAWHQFLQNSGFYIYVIWLYFSIYIIGVTIVVLVIVFWICKKCCCGKKRKKDEKQKKTN